MAQRRHRSAPVRRPAVPPQTVVAEKVAAGGDAIAHLDDGRVVFVDGAIPGETVQVAVHTSKKDFAKASVLAVLEPSPDRVVAPSKDRVQVSYQVAVYYRLNTDLLRPFHEQFGLKYQAYTPSGWNALIEDTFRQQLENAIQEETRRYAVADIYGDADLLLKIQGSVQTTLSDRLELAMGKRYFCSPTFQPGGECSDPTFVIKKVDLPKSVITAFEANRTSEIQIKTKTNEVEQRKEEARGVEVLNAALGPNGAVYALLKAIESGGVKFWVLPSDGGVTLNTPDGATGTTATPGN